MCCFFDMWFFVCVYYMLCWYMLCLKDSGFENLKVVIVVFIDLIF